MIAVLGSGFGLYGYLPAIVGGGWGPVALPEPARKQFESRGELARFRSAVRWFPDFRDALAHSEVAVIALPPGAQTDGIDACSGFPGLRLLFLEKPLAATPLEAARLLARLEGGGCPYRIGYTFRQTAWGRDFLRAVRGGHGQTVLHLQWHFMAHNFRHDLDSWKGRHDSGGGAMRFYGIHLLALLAEAGYRRVLWSHSHAREPGGCDRWQSAFGGDGLPTCELSVDTRAREEVFRISRDTGAGTTENVLLEREPFGLEAVTEGLDRRIGVLTRHIRDAMLDPADVPGWYGPAIELWKQVEDCNQPALAAAR